MIPLILNSPTNDALKDAVETGLELVVGILGQQLLAGLLEDVRVECIGHDNVATR